jgi:hypothetical protein
MSDTGDWSDDSDQGTPLPPRLAAVARAASAEVMDTGGDFDVASSIFGTRTPTRKKGKQSITGQMRMSSLLPPPATPSASTTLLSYTTASPMTPAPASSPAPSTFSTPCPGLASQRIRQPNASMSSSYSCKTRPTTSSARPASRSSLNSCWHSLGRFSRTPPSRITPSLSPSAGPPCLRLGSLRLLPCLGHRRQRQPPLLPFPLQWRRLHVLLPPSMRPRYLHHLRRSLGPLPQLHFRDPPRRGVLRLRPLQHPVVVSLLLSPPPPQCLWGRSLMLLPLPL